MLLSKFFTLNRYFLKGSNSMKRFIGDKQFYKMVFAVALPIIIQNAITNFVNLLDNIMVGSLSTEAMTGVSIVNQLFFVFNLTVFGAISAAGIFTAQYHGLGDSTGEKHTFRFKFLIILIGVAVGIGVGVACKFRASQLTTVSAAVAGMVGANAAAIIGGTLLRGAIYLSFGSTTFWTKSPLHISGFFQELFNRTNMYPLSMYPRGVQFVFTFIMPMSWVAFYPAAEFMGKDSMLTLPYGMSFITLGLGVLLFVIACKIFRAGFAQYESAGS